jgi:hypothetical protein
MDRTARARLAVTAILLSFVALGHTASAAEPFEPLPVTSVSPANNATITLPSAGIPFQFASPLTHLENVYVKVAGKNVVGKDGILAEDSQGDQFLLHESSGSPGTYRGESGFKPGGAWWSSRPGTYYWQIIQVGLTPEELHQRRSSVYTLVIAPATGAGSEQPGHTPGPGKSPATTRTLKLGEAYAAVKKIITSRTRRSPYHLSDKCRKKGQSKATCVASWFSARHLSSSAFSYGGTFNLVAQPQAIRFSFAGLRERYGCRRHGGPKPCASKLRWHS